MFETESKEIHSAYRSLQFLEKLPPSIRRDRLMAEISHWLNDENLKTEDQIADKLTNAKQWINILEKWIDDHGGNVHQLWKEHGKPY